MTLKPSIAHNVAYICGGSFIAFVGFVSAFVVGFPAALIASALGALGLLLIFVGVTTLVRRADLAITIDESGITIPAGSILQPRPCVHIPREAIKMVSKEESLRGRLIVISLRTGFKVPIQARGYCKLEEFLAHCTSYGLPTS